MTIAPWKQLQPIPSLQGVYGATQDGRIVRLVGGRSTHPGRALKARADSCGYLNVVPYVDGKAYPNGVHKYVAEAFYGPVPNGMHVCHANHDKTDNRIENLWVGTNSQNTQHTYDTVGEWGTNRKGVPSGKSKLQQHDFDEIRRLRAMGFKQTLLAALYGISSPYVSAIISQKHGVIQ